MNNLSTNPKKTMIPPVATQSKPVFFDKLTIVFILATNAFMAFIYIGLPRLFG
jgi:hypothetical protein